MPNEPDSFAQEESSQDNSIKGSFAQLNKSQKIASAVLAFFAAVVFFAWAVNLRQSIMGPLDRSSGTVADDQKNNSEAGVCASGDCGDSQLEEGLKQQDTDGDGLNDWDELNVYKTSPYIADSDSDGFSDGQEVESGNDPNCPSGAVCGAAEKDYGADQPAVVPDDRPLTGIGVEPDGADGEGSVDMLEKMLSGQVSPAEMRALLNEAGMDNNFLEQINDEDLMQYYQETLDSFNAEPASSE